MGWVHTICDRTTRVCLARLNSTNLYCRNMNLQRVSLLYLLFALEVAASASHQRLLRDEVFAFDVEDENATEHVPTATTQDEQRDLMSIESVKVDQEPCDEGFQETDGTEVTLPPTDDVRRPSKCLCPIARCREGTLVFFLLTSLASLSDHSKCITHAHSYEQSDRTSDRLSDPRSDLECK